MSFRSLHETLFRIERELTWQQKTMGLKPTVATFDDLDLAIAAWRAAVEKWPDQRLKLLNRSRIMESHPSEN